MQFLNDIEKGDRQTALAAIRKELITNIADAQGKDKAGLVKELRATLLEMNATDAVRKADLEFARGELAGAVDLVGYRDIPPLMRELRVVLVELEGVGVGVGKSVSDELAAARLQRRRSAASAHGVAPAVGD